LVVAPLEGESSGRKPVGEAAEGCHEVENGVAQIVFRAGKPSAASPMLPLRSGTLSETKVTPRLVTLAGTPEGYAMVERDTAAPLSITPTSVCIMAAAKPLTLRLRR
jgi:hypothetical protein